MEKKNQKLFIIVGVLLLFGGVSLAYFVSKILTNSNGGNTSVTTAVINGATVNVEGVLSFEDLDILPGHKSVSSIKVTATGNNELIPYNLIWQGTNTLTTPLNFTIYKTSERIEIKATCENKSKMIGASKAIYEECNISNIDRLGTEIATGVINKNDAKVTLAKDEFITAVNNGISYYYYVILEYPNLDEPQNYDLEGSIEGEVTVEESNLKPDINILAAYVAQEDGTYKEVEDIPQEGYTINQEKSTCSNGAIPIWDNRNKGLLTTNLTKSGTSCYLYFDVATAGELILESIDSDYIKEGMPNFNKVATGTEADEDNGIYKALDPMYGENAETYYWRGAVTSNHVIFANKCWRIIRINGDGSIRLIYNGAVQSGNTCTGNGSNSESIAVSKQAYSGNNLIDNPSYVGYTYTLNSQRPTPTTGGTTSNLKTQTETWYNNNIGNNEEYAAKVADGKYCNDRTVGYGSFGTSTFSYGSKSRLETMLANQPSLACDAEDVYKLKVGAITADEAAMAGGITSSSNSSYYLYNGQHYWTMSPTSLDSQVKLVYVYTIGAEGHLVSGTVGYNTPYNSSPYGIRPVINLKSNVKFSVDSKGTRLSPFIVQ